MIGALRFLGFAALAYGLIVAALFVLQSRFIYPAPQTMAALTPGYEEVTLTTQDGLQLRAFYRAPSQGAPSVLYFHGNGGTLEGASVSNGALTAAGLGVLLVEYRGYGGNPGTPSEQGFYRDADAALRWLRDEGHAASDLFVIGNSIGGGVATYAPLQLAEAGSPPAGLVLVAPFTSLVDAASDSLWWVPVRALLRERYDNAARLERLSQIPILIQHGTADTVIDDSHGRALADISEGIRFQSFESSGHSLSFERRSQAARLDWVLEQSATR
ncbi:alpha/beta hydrolase [Erythrobacter sp. KY5]|uniref:alpha/beta hydrolase n=1 Tax=Erythrobacter sp. KY5 TaxID=2011159 RepID=UPI000DBEF59A|nr:alpha/beta hydrolase [Erythrobacter sp. KY5]AWW73317.1 alpha/beta hydrolase [Erythrobacter sp. KY5]